MEAAQWDCACISRSFQVFYRHVSDTLLRLRQVFFMDRLAPVRAFLDSLPCAVYSRHESLCRLGNSQTVVVFVHGIQGSPSQFGWLMDVLPPETDFVNLLLPGHGRSVRAFRKAGKADWENTVSELVRLLSRTYRRIIWVGHSMGCLLGLHAARLMPDAFSALLLLNCPFALRPTWRYLRNNLLATLLFIPSSDPYVLAAREANSVPLRFSLSSLFILRPYWGLLRMIRNGRRDLRPLPMPVYACWAERDEIVSPASMDFAAANGFEGKCYDRCGHNYLTDEARHDIQQTFVRILSQ